MQKGNDLSQTFPSMFFSEAFFFVILNVHIGYFFICRTKFFQMDDYIKTNANNNKNETTIAHLN